MAAAASDDNGTATAEATGDVKSLYGVFADKCEVAAIKDDDGVVQDVDMAAFLEVGLAYRAALAPLGTAVKLVLGDFDANYNGTRKAYEENPSGRATARSFLEAESSDTSHTRGVGSACRLKDPSGACQMQWLLRGFHFFGTFLKLMFEDDTACGAHAYEQALKPYHGWLASTASKAAVMGMPSKDSVCRMETLCPELAQDKERLKEVISRDIQRATALFVPIVHRMIAIQRELELWEERKV